MFTKLQRKNELEVIISKSFKHLNNIKIKMQ